jgi:hypothetical protein
MDSFADWPQSPSPQRARHKGLGSFPGGRGLAWIVGLFLSVIAAALAAVLAVAVAATMVVVAVMGGALLLLAPLALRARRAVRAHRGVGGPQLLEARHIGGHSWVAYSWDRRP